MCNRCLLQTELVLGDIKCSRPVPGKQPSQSTHRESEWGERERERERERGKGRPEWGRADEKEKMKGKLPEFPPKRNPKRPIRVPSVVQETLPVESACNTALANRFGIITCIAIFIVGGVWLLDSDSTTMQMIHDDQPSDCI
jgi:hypothetical protein